MTLFTMNMKESGTVNIDGRTFKGKNITITGGGKVIVDGIEQDGNLINDIEINVEGDVDNIKTTNGNINVSGNVETIQTTNGDVSASSITGKVKTTNGDITSG